MKLHLPRLALATLVALAVGGASLAQAVSELATDTDPASAIRFFPANGAAYENLASAAFGAKATAAENIQPAASDARPLALEAVRRDPSSARAYALIALAEPSGEKRNTIALAASRTNRRDLSLQGVVLEAHTAAKDYPATVETLDQIMRVHRNYWMEFYPLLGEALKDERAVPVFARLLDGSTDWHEYFYTNYALGQPELLTNVARLREQRDLAGPEFDANLIRVLAEAGEAETAARLYSKLSKSGGAQAADGNLGWAAQFPPFDWRFTDESDFRGQPSTDGERLELFARPGKGGVIAQRIVPLPGGPFQMSLDVRGEGDLRDDSIRIDLTCPGAAQPFASQALSAGENRIAVGDAPGCAQALLTINARAFTGSPTLRAELGAIALTPR